MLYGRPTKHIRHVDETTLTIGPQRFQVHPFWRYKDTATARVDGQDLQDDKLVPIGSKITSHRVEILMTPETIEPQQIYMGTIALSFSDITHHALCGGRWAQTSYSDTTNDEVTMKTNPITPHMFPKIGATDGLIEVGYTTGDQEIGGSSSGFGITEWKLDDHIKHWIRLKKLTVFDQRPLVSDREQPIPSKAKRGNEGLFYGLFIFNDSVRGATPADTQITVNIKENWTEMAI